MGDNVFTEGPGPNQAPPPPDDDDYWASFDGQEAAWPDEDANEPSIEDLYGSSASGPRRTPRRSSDRTGGRGSSDEMNWTRAEMAAKVLDTVRDVLAAQHGRTMREMSSMIHEIKANPRVLDELDEDTLETLAGVFEILLDAAGNTEGGKVDLHWLPAVMNYDRHVQAEIETIAARTEAVDRSKHPSDVWYALKEAVQRRHARRRAMGLVSAIDEQSTVETIMERFRDLEPPTTKRSMTRARAARTARQVIAEKRAAQAGRPKVRFSSGYRTLDLAFTATGEPLGFIAPGEGSVVAGPTGTGKSSFSYGIIPSLTQDIVNWGYPEGKLIFCHTEEESEDKIRACGLDDGQAFHHLADNVIVSAVGTSREALIETVYDTVIDAHRRAIDTGQPIDQFLPHVFVLDYIQSIKGQNEDDTSASARTAELLLRGIQAWNPEEMAKFSGVDFQSYAGMAWPDGMTHHRVAGIYFAQLVKQDDKSLLYRPNSRDCQLSDFVLEDDNGGPSWDVREGDLRLFKQNAIRGSGIILQNATTILILHRSRPYNNPATPPGEDGIAHLSDTRARLILDKTRTGSKMKYVPMSFDLQRNGGGRAQYFDVLAEEAIADGLFTPHDCFRQSGDPILKARPARSPLAGYRY